MIDHRQILGIKIDYNSEPGRDMWERVERFVEESVPRNERVPVPVLCAKDEHSLFETYEPRRNSRGSLELRPAPVPEIDLGQFISPTKAFEPPPIPPPAVPSTPPPSTGTTPPSQTALFVCPNCDYTHRSQQGIRMHNVKRHPKKEMVGTK